MADNKFEEEVFEDGPPKEAKTIHRMRANSTIMQINKILGELPPWGPMPLFEDGVSERGLLSRSWLTLNAPPRSCKQRRNS